MDDSRRDDVFDRELRRALAAGGGAAPGPHLDAELAAAWMDRRLDAGAGRAIEVHLSNCADCQALMATLAQLIPDEPGVAAVSWWRRIRAGWLVPATVAAAAGLVIWVAVPQQRATPPVPAPASSAMVAAPPVPAERDAASQDNLQQLSEPQRQAANERELLATRPPPPAGSPAVSAPPAPEAKRSRFADAAGLAETRENASVSPQQPAADARRQDKATVTGDSPAAAPERQEAAAAAAAAPPRAVPVAPAPPPDAGITQQQRSALDRSTIGALAGLRAATALTIAAPDGAARWRRTGSVVEFAPGAGAPFAPATLPASADAVAAGASPGGTVCWLVGGGGLVLVTGDGLRFARVTAPAPLDLLSVTPTDARVAIVTAVNGRRFRTTDQGASWTALP